MSNVAKTKCFAGLCLMLVLTDGLSALTRNFALDGRHDLSITGGSELERDLAYDAFDAVVTYFVEKGFLSDLDEMPKVVFEEKIHVDGKYVPDALGLYQPDSRTIHLLPFSSEKFAGRRLLGIGCNRETYRSILVHEFTHFVMSVLVPDLLPSLDELIASTVQLTLMDPETRESVLEIVEPVAIKLINDVQMGLYWNNPDGFFVGAYLYCRDRQPLFENLVRGRGPRVKDPLTCEL